MSNTLHVPRFPLGKVVVSLGAHELINQREIIRALLAHAACDWGIVDHEDWHLNDEALDNESRILSVYADVHGNRFYVITEADRSATTVLLPSEY